MPEKRQPAPEPPAGLIEQMKRRKVVPFIGAGFSKSAQRRGAPAGSDSGMPTYPQLLRRLFEKAGDIKQADREIIQNYLDRKTSGDSDDYDEAARTLGKVMGEVRFYMTIREVLEPIDRDIEGSPAHKLLGGLGFRRLVTTNYDRLLEQFTAPGHEMITPNDERAFKLFMTDHDRSFILKLHGDITRPDTIPWGRDELLRYYGYDGFNRPLPELPGRTQNLRWFLKELFEQNSVLFLGTSLASSEGFAQVLINLVRDWGGSLPYRHYTLVAHDPALQALREDFSRRMNLTYLYYHPDATHSQVWEFISCLKAGRPRAAFQAGGEWEQWYLQKERPEYLLTQLEQEKTATAVRYLTPKLTNAIATEEYLAAECRDELAGRYEPEVIDRIIAAMQERATNLATRLRQDSLQARALFLESELRQSLDSSGAAGSAEKRTRATARYRLLLALDEETGLEFRLIPALSADQLKRREASFALIFNRPDRDGLSEPLADVMIAYSSQATNDFPEIHMVHINTQEIWRHMFVFERFWEAALSNAESRRIVRELIDPAPAAPGPG
jgi:SIR2-like domain